MEDTLRSTNARPPPLSASEPSSSLLSPAAPKSDRLIWETYAISYDCVLKELDFYNDVVSRHASALSVQGIDRIIDIGAGTGNVTIPLVRTGRFVTAVDISRAMLDRMRSKLSRQDNAKITILQQDAKDLSPLADGSFDGVNVLLALFAMNDPAAALKEAIRVLRPGGSLIITEPKRAFKLVDLLSQAESCLKNKKMYDRLSTHWKRVRNVNERIDPTKRSVRLYVEDIQDLLGRAGFSVIRNEGSHHGNCATIWAIKSPR